MKNKIYLFLPVLFACNMATNSNEPTAKSAATDTTTVAPQPVVEQTKSAPQLQAIKWSGLKEMTDETFKSDVLASSSITLVDFNATWCGPCKQQKPILDKLVKEYAGKINFASVDVDECPATASYYKVSSIPTLAFYHNAKQENATVGLTSYEELKEMIEKQITAK